MKRLAIPFLFLLLPLASIEAARAGQAPSPQHFTIVAKRFSFSPGEITVQKGRPVILDLTSLDVTHGLHFKEFDLHVTIRKGKTTEVEFTPTQTGRFVGRCSHFCGIGHGSMTLAIDVVDK